ncbi:unnamed protein product [Leptidea sinapis]|uniref:Uncharacterized protein n=1 Tax=Leptidea sinapis TaxID=189913 RepID=A0A5E4QLL3_9NEOP|nr:unnamed protein product [Leptidea sinapis]
MAVLFRACVLVVLCLVWLQIIYLINERVHIATDHLGRFIKLHIQELKVLLITLDDVIDNMMTMYENHNSIAAERKATYTGGPVPMEVLLRKECLHIPVGAIQRYL